MSLITNYMGDHIRNSRYCKPAEACELYQMKNYGGARGVMEISNEISSNCIWMRAGK